MRHGVRAAVLGLAALVLVACQTGSAVRGTSSPAAAPAPGSAGASPTPSVPVPAVGDCYQLDAVQAGDPLASPPAVDCASPHDAETIFVLASALRDVTAYPTRAQLPHPDEGPDTTDQVSVNVAAVCNQHLLATYLGGTDDDWVYPTTIAHLPTPAQWAGGARWVRCDAVYGSGNEQPPAGRLAGALHRAGGSAYRLCLTGSPYDYTGTPCSRPHQAEVTGFATPRPGTPYPSTAAARERLATDCPHYESSVKGVVPPGYVQDVWVLGASGWPDGTFTPCVVVPTGRGTTTTSVVDRPDAPR